MTRIAFLGLGAMGARMAASLVESGFDLTLWNRDPHKAKPLAGRGAKIAGTPRAAAAGADVVISMVRDDDASGRVWLDPNAGALGGMRAGAIAIECSTLTTAATLRLAEAARAHGVDLLDAPVAGSRPQAEARQLIFLVGGAADVLARAAPVLGAMGGAVHHAGPSGAGMALKLAVNALFAVQVAAVAEIMGALAAQGVDGARAAEIIGATPVASPAAKGAMASMATAAYAPLFPVDLVDKDLRYACAAAEEAGAGMPIALAASGVFTAAHDCGFGAEHLTAVRKLY